MLLQVRAKVRLYSEEDVEIEGLDVGTIVTKNQKWGWRDTGLVEEEIYKIMAFSKERTLIQMYDKELILVMGPFKEVYDKWMEARQASKEPFADPTEEENNEESENFDEEREN